MPMKKFSSMRKKENLKLARLSLVEPLQNNNESEEEEKELGNSLDDSMVSIDSESSLGSLASKKSYQS